MLPICLQKDIQELHFVSTTLFLALLTFIIIVFLQLMIFGPNEFSEGLPISFSEFQTIAPNATLFTFMKSFCCFIVAYGFSQNLFPVYSGLRVKTNENCQHVVNLSVTTSFFIYTLLSISGVFLFGHQIENSNANILNNINDEYAIGLLKGHSHWEAYVLRVLFLVVLACHIPFIFFSGKEALLIIIDETDR